jgi:Fe-Mn family superoxide dismutase
MTYSMKPLGCDPARTKGMSERLIVSHYENSYGGTVKRLNLIEEKLAELDYGSAPAFVVNGLKREQLIAMNSIILHELFFDGLGDESAPGNTLRDVLARDFGSYERWRSEFVATGKALRGGSGGCCWLGRRAMASSSINGRPSIATRSQAERRSSRSTCTSTPITSISAPRPTTTLRPS